MTRKSPMQDIAPNVEPRLGNNFAAHVRVLAGASVGTLIEFYDFTIYGLLVPVIAASYFPAGNKAVAVISAFAVYGVAYVIRPLGGAIFGAIGDRVGRRRVLSIVLTLIGVATALVGIVPTYSQIGVLAPILLVILRLLQGLSAGGETTSATSFAIEHAPPNRRAFWATIIVGMTALGSIVGSLIVLGISGAMSDAAFTSWGWRIVFLIALPLSLTGLYIRLRTEESPAFEKARKEDQLSANPVRDTLRHDRRAIVLAFGLASMTALALYMTGGYFPTFLQTTGGLSRTEVLVFNILIEVIIFVFLITAGIVADRVGRRVMIRAGGILVVLLSVPAFLAASGGGIGVAFLGLVLLAAGPVVFGGGSFVTLLELFPTRTRLSGAAIGYNLGYGLVGGTAPLLASLLVEWTGNKLSPGLYLVVGAIVLLVIVWRVPETKDAKILDDPVADGPA